MKRIAYIALTCFALTGCGRFSNYTKHLHSWAIGLDRKITLFDTNGHVIREWRTRAQIEDHGGSVYFIANGKAVTIAGTFLVEEQ